MIMWGQSDRLVHYTGACTYQARIAHADVLLFEVPVKEKIQA